MKSRKYDEVSRLLLAVSFFVFMPLTFIGAWITHIIVCLSDDRWGFLIAGALMFPVAIIHGIGAWFGAW